MDDMSTTADTGAPSIELPGFLALETGDGNLPVAIAWSLPDGRIKQTLIQPDPDWLEETADFGTHSEEALNTLGLSAREVARELEADYYGATLYTAGVIDDTQALSRLFEAAGSDVFVELLPAETLYEALPDNEWREQRSELFSELGLEPLRAEDELQAMLTLHLRFQEDDTPLMGDHGPDIDE